jgi:predicted dehydrogenase
MTLTPEQEERGRRNFLRALAGTPAVLALGASAALRGPVKGGPVRLGYIGVGSQGRTMLEQADPSVADVRALCDVNPGRLARADADRARQGRPPIRHYEDWREMLQKEDLEAVVIALPLSAHAEVTVACLEAGRHVLCEKMMAWDVAGAERMRDAAQKARRVLEIGYQRFYNPIYQAAYDGIVKTGALGDVYHARLLWHRNGNWRRSEEPPSPDFDPSRWGYPTFEHLLNWRLYWRYSRGLLAELGSHQLAVANWFFGATPQAVVSTGGVHRYKDGREVPDHVYSTFEYPGGRTALFTTVESNAFENVYEMYMGTKGTLILRAEGEALLFDEGDRAAATAVETAGKGSGPALDASETRTADAAGRSVGAGRQQASPRAQAYYQELKEFCSAVRVGTPLRCGPERALASARTCLAAVEATDKKTRVTLA